MAKVRCVIIARTSTIDDKDDEKSIPEQVADCKELARKNGYDVIEVIKEPGFSGRLYPTDCALAEHDQVLKKYIAGWPRDRRSRPGLARLMELLPKVGVVVARDLERIARPLSGSHLANFLNQQFTGHNVKLHTVADGKIDPEDLDQQFMRVIREMAVDRELQKRARNSKAKLATLKDQGYMNSGAARFGFRPAGRQKVEPIEQEVRLVAETFKQALAGTPFNRIARWLNANDPGREWSVQRVLRILDRPEYFGYCRDTKKRLIESKVFPNVVGLDIEEWRKVQARRDANRRSRRGRRSPESHPASGILRCGFCGRCMRISNAVAFGTRELCYYYVCPRSYERDPEDVVGCRMARIPEATVLRLLSALAYARTAQDPEALTKAERDRKAAAAERELATLRKKEDQLVDTGALSSEAKSRQLARVGEQIKEAESALSRLSSLPVKQREDDDADPALKKMLRSGWLSKDALARRLPEAVEDVMVFAFKAEIRLKGVGSLVVERVPDRFSRQFPKPHYSDQGKKLVVMLPYKSATTKSGDRTQRTLLDSRFLKVVALGSNPAYGERKRKRGEKVRPLPKYVIESTAAGR